MSPDCVSTVPIYPLALCPIMRRYIWSCLLVVATLAFGLAQHPLPSPPHQRADGAGEYRMQRQIIQDSSSLHHAAIRRYAISPRVDSVAAQRGFLGLLYRHPEHLYHVSGKGFSLGINFLMDLRIGRDAIGDKNVYLNKRGLEIYGALDDRLYFYSAYEENQSNLLDYRLDLLNEYQAIRGKGNYKDYRSRVFDSVRGFDYGFATAYLGYELSKSTRIEIGHNRHFIGHGIRSLLLSNSANNYFNVRLDVKFWKLHYQSIFAELSSISARFNFANALLPKKYMVNHYLSIKPLPNLELGIFEAIIFSRENNFELQYLNPVIFYRTLEHQLDSPDNVLLGLNGKWDLFQTVALYGQFILDEFRLNQFFSGDGWWGNKWGLQAGVHYLNVLGMDDLDLQLEYNRVRPWTYTHWQEVEGFEGVTVSNYSHYNQPLAHPLGANFTELVVQLRYALGRKLSLTARHVLAHQGLSLGKDAGQDILVNSNRRIGELGHAQNQGDLQTQQLTRLLASYTLTRGLYWDVEIHHRLQSNALSETSTFYWGTGLRYNVSRTWVDY